MNRISSQNFSFKHNIKVCLWYIPMSSWIPISRLSISQEYIRLLICWFSIKLYKVSIHKNLSCVEFTGSQRGN